jgi:hypothetical protein
MTTCASRVGPYRVRVAAVPFLVLAAPGAAQVPHR